jgi:hypothetical protein
VAGGGQSAKCPSNALNTRAVSACFSGALEGKLSKVLEMQALAAHFF